MQAMLVANRKSFAHSAAELPGYCGINGPNGPMEIVLTHDKPVPGRYRPRSEQIAIQTTKTTSAMCSCRWGT